MRNAMIWSDEERQLAFEIVRPLQGGEAARVSIDDRDLIVLELPAAPQEKLRTVTFSRTALKELAGDPDRAVKIEYLQRDLRQFSKVREEYRYPRQLPRLRRLVRKLFAGKAARKVEALCPQ